MYVATKFCAGFSMQIFGAGICTDFRVVYISVDISLNHPSKGQIDRISATRLIIGCVAEYLKAPVGNVTFNNSLILALSVFSIHPLAFLV